jgi:hypothetical protein
LELAVDFLRIRRHDSPITSQEWDKIIASHGSFEQIPDRAGINPSTKETIVFPGAGKAYYVVDREKLGNASLEGGEILTTGVPKDVCDQVALCLNANVFVDDRS